MSAPVVPTQLSTQASRHRFLTPAAVRKREPREGAYSTITLVILTVRVTSLLLLAAAWIVDFACATDSPLEVASFVAGVIAFVLACGTAVEQVLLNSAIQNFTQERSVPGVRTEVMAAVYSVIVAQAEITLLETRLARAMASIGIGVYTLAQLTQQCIHFYSSQAPATVIKRLLPSDPKREVQRLHHLQRRRFIQRSTSAPSPAQQRKWSVPARPATSRR